MYDKFFAYLDGLDKSFAKLAELLHQKLAALERFDPDEFDAIIKQEQAHALKSKGFGGSIEGFKKELGLTGGTLSEVIAELPEGEKGRFGQVFARLTTSLDVVKKLNDKCTELTENRLHVIDRAIKELDKTAGTRYGETVKPAPSDAPKLINRSI